MLSSVNARPTDTTQIALSTSKVKAYVNLEQKYAEFTYRNPTEINNTFILNNYVGSFEKLKMGYDTSNP
jgi:hypothetical protein